MSRDLKCLDGGIRQLYRPWAPLFSMVAHVADFFFTGFLPNSSIVEFSVLQILGGEILFLSLSVGRSFFSTIRGAKLRTFRFFHFCQCLKYGFDCIWGSSIIQCALDTMPQGIRCISSIAHDIKSQKRQNFGTLPKSVNIGGSNQPKNQKCRNFGTLPKSVKLGGSNQPQNQRCQHFGILSNSMN